MAIREILRNQRFTPVAHTPPHVAGVLNLRGEIIPVFDMRKVLVLEDAPGAEEAKLVVVCARGRTLGLLVDQVLDVVAVGPDALMPVPGASGGAARVVLAAFRKEESPQSEVAVLLSLGALVDAGVDAPLEEGCPP
jgi:purine-binding chemotaxis protein CheW